MESVEIQIRTTKTVNLSEDQIKDAIKQWVEKYKPEFLDKITLPRIDFRQDYEVTCEITIIE